MWRSLSLLLPSRVNGRNADPSDLDNSQMADVKPVLDVPEISGTTKSQNTVTKEAHDKTALWSANMQKNQVQIHNIVCN